MSDKNQQRNGKAIIQMNLRPLFSVVTRYRRCTKDYGNKPFADCASITPWCMQTESKLNNMLLLACASLTVCNFSDCLLESIMDLDCFSPDGWYTAINEQLNVSEWLDRCHRRIWRLKSLFFWLLLRIHKQLAGNREKGRVQKQMLLHSTGKRQRCCTCKSHWTKLYCGPKITHHKFECRIIWLLLLLQSNLRYTLTYTHLIAP